MANTIKIKAGTGTPDTNDIVDRELAFDRSANKLYIRDNDDIVDLSGSASLDTEAVQDIVGAMFSGNTETRISATYQDGDGTIDLVVDDMTADTNTQLSTEQVQDIVGAMFSGNTETRITATYQDSDGTIDLVVDDLDTDTQLTTENVQDIVGAMFTSNTETRISATYQDGDGTIDLVVDDMTADTNTQLSTEQVQDIVGAMFSGNTETRISATYQDGDGTIDLVVDDMTANTQLSNSQVRSAVEAASDSNVFTDADHSKLNGIEASATADQTASEILTAIKTVDGGGSGLDADTLDGIQSSSFLRSDADDTTSGTITAGGFTTTGTVTAGASSNQIRLRTVSNASPIADTFSGNTEQSYIDFLESTSTNDPGYIMHETRDEAETNEGVIHLCPSDDNADGDYVSIHGTNDADTLKLHTSGKIEGVTTLVATTLDISGNADIDGTLETDALTINGTTSVAFTSSDHSKLDGIEASADVTDTSNVTSAGALMDSECTNLSAVKGINQALTTSSDVTFSSVDADTIDVSGDLTLDADGADIILKDGGTEYGRLTNFLGGLTLKTGSSAANGLIFSADGTTMITGGSIQMSGGFVLDGNTITGVDDSGEFTDDDAHIMTSAAVNDRIQSFGYVTSDTTLSTEQVQDIVGAMFSSNTETRISATYQDGDGTIDLVVDDMTANDNTQLSNEQVQDIVGAMFSGNTETRISATYQDGDGTIDLVVDDFVSAGDTVDFNNLTCDQIGVNVSANGTNGRIDAGNDIVAFSSSDKRLKENIKPLDNALDKVSKINGIEFDWKPLTKEEKKTIHGNEGHDVGVIAQEIEEVLPEVVQTRDTGYKAVKYEKIVPLLIEAIKELKTEIEELKK